MTNVAEKIYEMMINGKNYLACSGIRCDDREYEVGDELDCSKNMLDDVDEEEWEDLDGTCATGFDALFFQEDTREEDIETIAKAIEFNKKLYRCKHQYFICGWSTQYGDDDHEVIISGAEVVVKIN